MGKHQQPIRPRRGRPPGSSNKSPVKKSTGILDKYVTSKMEKAITSVQIKREKLDESIKESSKLIVSPDKNKLRRSKTDKISKSPISRTTQNNKDKNNDIIMKESHFIDVEKVQREICQQNIQEDITTKITQDNVFTYIEKSRMSQLLALPLEQMRHIMKSWKISQNEDDPDIVQTMTMDTLMLDIEEAKEEITAESRREILRDRIENELREDLKLVKSMNLTKSSNLSDIQQFTKEELCRFIQYTNKDEDKKLPYKMIQDKSIEEIQEWSMDILKHLPVTDPDTNQIIHHNKPFQVSQESNAVINIDDNTMDTDEKRNTNDKEMTSFKIDSSLQDRDIMKASTEVLKRSYHQFTIESGVPVKTDTIDLWPKTVLQEIIKSKRDVMAFKTSTKVKKNSSILKQTSKYSGKKSTQTSLLHRGKVMNTCRYSLAFTIPDEYKGTEGLRKYFIDIFHEMVNYADEGFCLLPWDSDDITGKIMEPDAIPDRITDIKKYFNGARSPESSVYIYTKIRLGFPIQSDKTNFDADIQGWCKNRSIRFYVCSVQHPNVKSCGWLAYMPRTVNQEKWCQSVTQLYDTINKDKMEAEFQIGLTWRVLNGQKDVNKKDKLRAMHVDAPVEIATRVKRFLRALSNKKKWILGVKYRVMDEFHQYMKPTAKQKYRYMVTKHRAMMNQIAMCDCTQIINLDKKIGDSNMTVRDIVVNIRDNEDNYRVFASIDEKWNSDTLFTATYRPDKATKAYDFMRSLATYVQYLFPDASLKRIFTLDAIEKAKSEKYHPGSQTFITQDDTELDREIQADMDDDSMGFLEIEGELDNPFEIDGSINLVGGNSVWNFQGDDETVSTAAGSAGGISFNSAHIRYYDTKSCASSVASSVASKDSTSNSTEVDVPKEIQEQLKQLKETATHRIAEEEASDVVADPA